MHHELSFQALSNQMELVILKEVWSQLFHCDLRFFSIKHLREEKSKEYEEMWVFVKRRLVQARLQGQVPPKAPNKWQRCIVFESHSLESTGHHYGKTPVAQAPAALKPAHKSKQVNSSEGKTLLENSGGWTGLSLSQTQASRFTLGLSFRPLFGTKAVTLWVVQDMRW